MGPLPPSALRARLFRRTRWVTVGSPAYLARHAVPKSIADLGAHNCLRFVAPDGKARDWSFTQDGRETTFRPAGNFVIDQGEQLQRAAAAGMGLCQVLDFMVEEELREGTLVELLPASAAEGPAIHTLTTAARASSANVRAFLQFLLDRRGTPVS